MDNSELERALYRFERISENAGFSIGLFFNVPKSTLNASTTRQDFIENNRGKYSQEELKQRVDNFKEERFIEEKINFEEFTDLTEAKVSRVINEYKKHYDHLPMKTSYERLISNTEGGPTAIDQVIANIRDYPEQSSSAFIAREQLLTFVRKILGETYARNANPYLFVSNFEVGIYNKNDKVELDFPNNHKSIVYAEKIKWTTTQ